MANYATNIFHARTENKTDLDKIEAFLDDTFSEFTNRYGDSVDAEFSSRWVYPEEEIKKLVESLEDKDKVYIKILTYEFEDEYVSFRILCVYRSQFPRCSSSVPYKSCCAVWIGLRQAYWLDFASIVW